MKKPPSVSKAKRVSMAENIGYGIGGLATVLQEMMPLRMWITLGLSFGLVLKVFRADSMLEVARWTAAYLAVMMLLIGSVVFSKRR